MSTDEFKPGNKETSLRSDEFDVIYADPPWRYSFSPSKNRRVENHYPTMSQRELTQLEVPSAKNSVLYLWATAPKLLEALEVMDAWGFSYKSQAVWDKEVLGMGYWWRGQHELLLVGTRGSFSPPQPSLRRGSVFRIRRTKHSRKPPEIRDAIDRWYPEARKLELFCRDPTPGWFVWGNEVEDNPNYLSMSSGHPTDKK